MNIVIGSIIIYLFTFTLTFSQVIVTFPSTENLPQRTSCDNGDPGGYATLGTIVIQETQNNDFSAGGNLILLAPANWQFNPSSTPSATILSAPTDLSVSLSSVTSLAVNYSITVNSTANLDFLVLHSIKIQAIDCNSINDFKADVKAFLWLGLTINGMTNGSTIGTVSVDPTTPLPVELTSFSAILNEASVHLYWRTETEVNNYGFEIQRAYQEEEWKAIGFVDGNGNSNSPLEYSFTDAKVSSSGIYYYRLKQIDNDGAYGYSDQIEVNFEAPNNLVLNQNYPNPFNPTTTISFNLPEAGIVSLKIYNLMGEEIATLVDDYMQAGIYKFDFNAEGHPSGMYLYRLSTSGFTDTKKMLFLK